MDGMAIDNMIGSQALLTSEYTTKIQKANDRSTMTLDNKKEIDTQFSQKKETKGMMISKESVVEAVDKMNSFLEPTRRNLKFELHEKLDKYYVSVIDSATSEVIKEIPPKKMLDMYAEMAEFMGILVDRKI